MDCCYVSPFTAEVVNCSFDQSMDVKELTSLAKQIQLAYTQVMEGCRMDMATIPALKWGVWMKYD